MRLWALVTSKRKKRAPRGAPLLAGAANLLFSSFGADVRECVWKIAAAMEYGYLSGASGGFDSGCLGSGGGELSWGELASCGQMSQAAYRYQGMRYQPPPPQCARPQDAAMRNHHIFPPAMNLQRKYLLLRLFFPVGIWKLTDLYFYGVEGRKQCATRLLRTISQPEPF